jgi:two-component system, cell cycle sensor histidine kinase and response regulator CckA
MPDPVFLPPPTVLVVDDQRVVRRLIQRLLSGAGYRTFEAENGAEALDVLGVTGHVDLVIVDVIMPRLNGAEFVRELLEYWPEQRVLYMSAHPAELLARYQAPNLEVPFLAKPFTTEALLAKVEEALRRTPTRPADRPSTS